MNGAGNPSGAQDPQVHRAGARGLGVLGLLLPLALTAAPGATHSRNWLEAVQLNTLATIAAQIREMDDVDLATANGKTALMAAAAGGSGALVRTLIDAGAQVTADACSPGSSNR